MMSNYDIIALQAVAKQKGVDLSWMEEGIPFKWEGQNIGIYLFSERDKTLCHKWGDVYIPVKNSETFHNMIRNPEKIKRIRDYTNAEAKQADIDMHSSARFTKVQNNNGMVVLINNIGGDWRIDATLYPSVKPGQTVLLSDIIKQGVIR